ncbi:MAG TPA: dUTP diphosphatase [Candidatus Saccharimonadales bacterium]|nr:dUTP diphosphatase [Candidatus Saccharimonadales bacterium]
MKIQIKRLKPKAQLPEYQTAGSAAVDLHACLDQPVLLKPLGRAIIPTGLSLAMPMGVHAEIRPRSGLAAKHGIALANGVATIDSDYRGEIGVILINLSDQTFEVKDGMRVAQMLLIRYETFDWREVEQLDETDRGEGGYGSTKH